MYGVLIWSSRSHHLLGDGKRNNNWEISLPSKMGDAFGKLSKCPVTVPQVSMRRRHPVTLHVVAKPPAHGWGQHESGAWGATKQQLPVANLWTNPRPKAVGSRPKRGFGVMWVCLPYLQWLFLVKNRSCHRGYHKSWSFPRSLSLSSSVTIVFWIFLRKLIFENMSESNQISFWIRPH